jgi:hypothetical protein
MNISAYSRARIMETFSKWEVPQDFADPMYNYMVFGFSPGGCFTAILANDWTRAISSSHSANTVQAFKALTNWILDVLPIESYGNYEAVKFWLAITDSERRDYLERLRLIHTEKEETWLNIKGDPVHEPELY